MRFQARFAAAAVLWTTAFGLALARTLFQVDGLSAWVAFFSAVALVPSGWLVVDSVVQRCADEMMEQLEAADRSQYVVDQLKGERDATVAATVKAIHRYGEGTADKIVSRLASKQDKTLEQMATDLAGALSETHATPFRRN